MCFLGFIVFFSNWIAILSSKTPARIAHQQQNTCDHKFITALDLPEQSLWAFQTLTKVYNQPVPFLPQTSQQNPKEPYFMLLGSFCTLPLKYNKYLGICYPWLSLHFCQHSLGLTRRGNMADPWGRRGAHLPQNPSQGAFS